MSTVHRWALDTEEMKKYIGLLSDELASLRAKLGITQGEIAYLIGISRQTYSAIESGKKPMSWATYIALISFFDYNISTHRMIRNASVFPEALIERFNEGKTPFSESGFFVDSKSAKESARMLETLDEQGIKSLETTLLVEYARCTGTTNELLKALK